MAEYREMKPLKNSSASLHKEQKEWEQNMNMKSAELQEAAFLSMIGGAEETENFQPPLKDFPPIMELPEGDRKSSLASDPLKASLTVAKKMETPTPRTLLGKLLSQAINGSVLDVYAAGTVLLSASASETEYQEVLSHRSVVQVTLADMTAYEQAVASVNADGEPLKMLQTILLRKARGSKLMFDITCAKSELADVKVSLLSKNLDCVARYESDIAASVGNLTTSWNIPANSPFKALNLNDALIGWTPHGSHHPSVHMTQALKVILKLMTEPMQAIKRYAYRFSQSGAKSAYQDFPTATGNLLHDFGLELVGLGHEELRDITMTRETVEKRNSQYWRKLPGRTADDKWDNLTKRRTERVCWAGAHFYKALQTALNDVRSSVIEKVQNADGTHHLRWTASNKKANPALANGNRAKRGVKRRLDVANAENPADDDFSTPTGDPNE